jgi:hypothetical protein
MSTDNKRGITQQSGAPIQGNPPVVTVASWGSLPKFNVVEATRRLIGSSGRKVSSLDIIKASKEQLIAYYLRMVGRKGELNPFLSDLEVDSDYHVPVLDADATREQCLIASPSSVFTR